MVFLGSGFDRHLFNGSIVFNRGPRNILFRSIMNIRLSPLASVCTGLPLVGPMSTTVLYRRTLFSAAFFCNSFIGPTKTVSILRCTRYSSLSKRHFDAPTTLHLCHSPTNDFDVLALLLPCGNRAPRAPHPWDTAVQGRWFLSVSVAFIVPSG